jgi:SWI/SNF-related matrix-associated actin-dependent regulator 1 of chromatin subfamily A
VQSSRACYLDLPPLLSSSIVIGIATVAQSRKFTKKLASIKTLRETAGTSAANAMLSELVRETSRVKLVHVLNYLTHLAATIDPETKTILWVKHVFVGNAIAELLRDKLKLKYIHIDGTVPHKDRELLLATFAIDPHVRFAVFGIQACGTGINVTCANLNIYTEMIFNSIEVAQSESRSHRLGQTKSVLVRRLIMEGTTDTLVEASVNRKREAEALVLGDDRVISVSASQSKKRRHPAVEVDQVDI